MSKLFFEKSLLAKLMAEENIIIEQKNVETASFSLKTRVLTIPTFKETVSSDILDVLFSHEIAHAKYTPTDDWLKVLENKASYENEVTIPKIILNVVEDARIERLIKNKYPGLKPSYIKGYNELIVSGFFGEKIKNDEISEFNFIDKLNIFFKIGHIRNYDYEFNEIESDLINEVSKTETFNDVIEVSRKISTYLKNKWENEMMEECDEYEIIESFEFSSEIEKEFYVNKSNLYSSDFITYVDIVDSGIDDMVVDYKALYRRLIDIDDVAGPTCNKSNFIKFKRKYSSVVSYLVKEFELRKNADQFKKTKISNSGDINLDKLFSYKLTDNIFKKIAITPNAKSHGLVFFLDWSASMEFIMEETIKQLLCLVLFCQKCNIPYEVFAFSDRYKDYDKISGNFYQKHKKTENLILDTSKVNLLNILSSRMNASNFSVAANTLLSFKNTMFKYDVDEILYVPYYFTLGSTPLNTSIINGIDVVNEFRKKYKLQIVNTVILTDGESNEVKLFKYYDSYNRLGFRSLDDLMSRSVFRYKKHKVMESFDNRKHSGWKFSRLNETKLFLNIFKKCTGCTVTGFYVIPKRHIKPNAAIFFTNGEYSAKLKEFKKHNCTSIQKYGFDDYHLIKYDNNFSDDSDFDFDIYSDAKISTKAIAKKFSNHMSRKLDNRIVLQKFIQRIT
jgi:hypothetical protein